MSYDEHNGCRIYCGDNKEVLLDIESNSIDLVIYDPQWPDPGPIDLIADAMKENAALYCFWSSKDLFRLFNELSNHLFIIETLAWARGRTWTPIVYAIKGDRERRENVDVYYNANVAHKIHPAQKPDKLIQSLIEASSMPGDLILDPSCGLGATCVASAKTGRRSIGIDIDKTYCLEAMKRVRAL
jgi:DNA modification methylase